jgi:parvulin-like peptidyl-prolyl isomerase
MKRFLLFLCVFLMFSVFSFGQIDLQPVAIVRLSKTEQITVKQFKEYVSWLTMTKAMSTGNPNAKLTETEKRQALDELGNQFLACQAAEQERITITDREINQYFDQSIKNFSEELTQITGRTPTDAELDAQLRNRTGMTRASFKELMKRSLVTENYLKVKKQSLFEAIKQPTEAEIQKIYNDYKDKSIFDGGLYSPESVEVRMLIVPFVDSNQKPTAQTTANNLSRKIGNDLKKFDEEDKNAERNNPRNFTGNEVICSSDVLFNHKLMRDRLGNPFVDAVFNLKQGQVSRVLEGPNGFYIIKVTKNIGAITPTISEARQAIIKVDMQRRFMITLQQASEELVTELKKKGSIQIMDDTYNKITW